MLTLTVNVHKAGMAVPVLNLRLLFGFFFELLYPAVHLFPVDADNATIEQTVLADERSQKYIADKKVMRVIIVPKKIVNVVIK